MIEHDALLDVLLRHAPEGRSFPTKIKGFRIARRDIPNIIERCLMTPVILMTVQGKKRSVIGRTPYEYGKGQATVLGMDIPADSCVLEASPEKPYISMVLELDAALITQISAELQKTEADISEARRHCEYDMQAVVSADADPHVYEAFIRLAELLDKPDQIPFLSPMILKEIHYHLLIGPLGKHIRAINTIGTQSNQIARAITWLEDNYKAPLKVNELAEHVNMAVSTFHRNFKQITSLSPLQFQKKLRLLEAQRIMLTEGVDATNAAYKVGYESPTQFNREYKRMFGNPPKKDIKNMLLIQVS